MKEEPEILRERITDLEVDLGRIAGQFGRDINDVSGIIADIRLLKSKEGDHSVNAILAMAMKRTPALAEARDAIDRQLMIEAQQNRLVVETESRLKRKLTFGERIVAGLFRSSRN